MDQGRDAVMDKVYCCAIPFIKATEQHQAAVDAGKPMQAIYVEGRGAETFEACVASFRTGGTLGLVGGLRVLGGTRKLIVERVRILKKNGIRPYDLATACFDEIELLNRAVNKIAGGRALKEDPRVPRRIGRKGGLAKGVNAQKKRDAIMQEAVVQRICTAPELNWKRRAEILGRGFSESTLRRLYGDN